MARFKSVLVESGDATATVAAYIDLNPVRTGLVERPEDYTVRWCECSEALVGSKRICSEGFAVWWGFTAARAAI